VIEISAAENRGTMAAPPQRNTIVLSPLFFLSGVVALVYEVLWQRKFSLLFGSSAPATACVLAAFFGGLSIGSLLCGKIAQRWERPLVVYAILEFIVAGGVLLVDPILDLYALAYPGIISRFAAHPGTLLVGRFL
jgi:spermidine synthase